MSNGKLDIFEQITEKIGENRAAIKVLEGKVDFENGKLKDRMKEIDERAERSFD